MVSPSLSCSIFFFVLWARSKYLFLFSLSLIFTLWPTVTAKPTIQVLLSIYLFIYLFLLIITKSSLLAGMMGSVCISKSQRIYALHSLGLIMVCAYTDFANFTPSSAGMVKFISYQGFFFVLSIRKKVWCQCSGLD